jgi:hypothetical protein
MTKVGKVIVLFTITAMALTLPLAAQFVQSGPASLESNTKKATAGVFSSSVDDFIDTRNWPGVSFEKWFGFVTGDRITGVDATDNSGDKTITRGSLGYAHKFGGLYLGAWYNGNILQMRGQPGPDITKTISADDDRFTQTQTEITTTTQYSSAWTNSSNQLTLLLGVGKHGIKLGFFESLAMNKNEGASVRSIIETDTKDGYKDYTNETVEYSFTGGHLRPYLGWGTAFGNSVTVKPYIDVAFDMYQQEKIDITRDYKTYNGKLAGDDTTTYHDGWNQGYYMPIGTVGSDFVKAGEVIRTTIGIKYDFNMFLYNNDYDVSGISGKSTKGIVTWSETDTTVKQTITNTTTTNNAAFTFADRTNQNHTLTPSYKIDGEPASGLKLGFRATVPVTFSLDATDRYNEEYTITRIVYNDVEKSRNTTETTVARENKGLTETTTLTVTPTLGVGASYKLIPNRFTVNAGVYAVPLSYRNTTIKTSPNGVNKITTTNKVDGNGVVIEEDVDLLDHDYIDDKVEHTETWNQFIGSVRAGFEFYFSPQFSVDLYAAASTDFDANISSLNVLFSFKF